MKLDHEHTQSGKSGATPIYVLPTTASSKLKAAPPLTQIHGLQAQIRTDGGN